MRVALLGNMNNNHFAIARFLRDRGVQADVLLFPHEGAHFHPSADTYDLDYMRYCRTVGWGDPVRWRAIGDDEIRRDLASYDVLMGCGFAPAFASRAGRRLDIFIPYGADLSEFTRFKPASPNRIPALWRAVAAQRRAIPQAAVIQMDHTNELYEQLWRRFGGNAERWAFGPPMVHTGTYSPAALEGKLCGTHWAAEFARVRESTDLLLMYHARHVWGGRADDANQKGTDRLLRGLALFRQRHPHVRIGLISLEYGGNVLDSRRLAAELGLEDCVHWFPQMYRKDLMVGVHLADVICGEFEHSWLSSGVIYEALAMGKPILAHREDALYASGSRSLYPILNARTPEQIADRIEEAAFDADGRARMGGAGREWYETQVVEPALDGYVRYLADRGSGR